MRNSIIDANGNGDISQTERIDAGGGRSRSEGALRQDCVLADNRQVRAAAADANLEFREDALSAKDLAGDSSSVIGVRGATCAYSLGKVFDYKSRALVNIWQQQGQLQQHQRHFLSVLNSHLARSIDRCPLFIPPRL